MNRSITIGQTSTILRAMLYDATNNWLGKSGLTTGDVGVSLTSDTLEPSILTAQTIGTIGVFVQPSSISHVRFGEVDAVRTPGLYEFQFYDGSFSSANIGSNRTLDFFVRGTTFVPYWESIPISQATVYVTPLSTTVSAGEVSENHLVAYQYASKSFIWGVVDDDGTAVNLSGKTVKLCIYKRKAPTTAVFTLSGTVSGASNNQVTVNLTSTETATATVYEYKLWDTTDDAVLARGTLTVEANPNTT